MNMTYINNFEIQGVVSYIREEGGVSKFLIHTELIDGDDIRTGADVSCECGPGLSLKDGQVVHVVGYFSGYDMWVNCFLKVEK